MTIRAFKGPELDRYIEQVHEARDAAVAAQICAWCGDSATTFRDARSEREFQTSGLCQGCQDDTFGVEEG